jgi:malate dehydrogenase (oxaloacetate-decarboxylating)(NADP+)
MSDEKRTFTDEDALAFHRFPRPGKLSVTPTKPMSTQRDLSLAYSPGVAVPVQAIADDPEKVYDYTSILSPSSPMARLYLAWVILAPSPPSR